MASESALEWAMALAPDFWGLTHGGWYGCLLTARSQPADPHADGIFMWAFGYGRTRDDAHEQAAQSIAEQKIKTIVWTPAG